MDRVRPAYGGREQTSCRVFFLLPLWLRLDPLPPAASEAFHADEAYINPLALASCTSSLLTLNHHHPPLLLPRLRFTHTFARLPPTIAPTVTFAYKVVLLLPLDVGQVNIHTSITSFLPI